MLTNTKLARASDAFKVHTSAVQSRGQGNDKHLFTEHAINTPEELLHQQSPARVFNSRFIGHAGGSIPASFTRTIEGVLHVLYKSVAGKRFLRHGKQCFVKSELQETDKVIRQVRLSMPLCRILCRLLNMQHTCEKAIFLFLGQRNNGRKSEVIVRHHTQACTCAKIRKGEGVKTTNHMQ